VQTQSDVLDRLEDAARGLLEQLDTRGWDPTAVPEVAVQRLGTADAEVCRTLRFACEVIVSRLERTPDEIANILRALQGEYVPPAQRCPDAWTGTCPPAHFYSVDPKTLPSPIAYQWARIWPALLDKYLAEEGAYPESVALSFGTSAMRTHGDDIGEVLALLGVRPVWQTESRRVTGSR
jgi:cobaltochelatase CobN